MKKLTLFTCLTLLCLQFAFAGTIILEGTYQKKNIYIVNSYSDFGVGFCTTEIRVNGNVTTDELNSSAFEIDLGQLRLAQGDEVLVEIKFKDGCAPKILNPKVLQPLPSFKTEKINLSPEGRLCWTTSGEDGTLPFIIQSFKWNKWVNIGEIEGKGVATLSDYCFEIDMVSGENKVRVLQIGYDERIIISQPARVISSKAQVTFTYDKREQAVNFSDDTNYEMYDEYGQIVKKGYSKQMNVSNLRKNNYWISFDSQVRPFTKK